MKNNFSLYVLSVFVSFSLTTRAMDEKKDDLVMQELQRIAEIAFPSPVYSSDSHPDDEGKLARATATAQDIGIFTIPHEIFFNHIIPYLDSKTFLLGFGQSCQSFYWFSQMSPFYLNAYCLTERMPHVIPVHTLRFKTHNTKGGLLKLAALASLSAENLCEWFEPSYLGSIFLSCQGSLPQQLEGQSEEALGALYPVLKVALAAIQAEVTTPEQAGHVMQLIREYTSPYNHGMSLNKLRLLSLNPDRPGVYYETLEYLFNGPHGYPYQSMDSSVVQIKEVIARELLRAGRRIASINNCLFIHNHPSKKDVAIEIMELCLQYPQLLSLHNGNMLVHDSLLLGRPNLALKVLSWVISLPDNANTLPDKVRALAQCKDIKVEDENIQSRLKRFASKLYFLHWAELPADHKADGLSILIKAGRRDDVQAAMNGILLLPEEEFLKILSDSLVSNLVEYEYPEEVNNLTLYALNMERSKFISAFPYIWDDFFEHAVKVDREKTIGLLKAYVESQMMLRAPKICFLPYLAEFAVTEEEKDYVTSYLHLLSEKEKDDDLNFEISLIYYYLGNKDLCSSYYQEVIKKMLLENGVQTQDFLQHVQQAGLNIVSFEEMLTLDPFEVLPILMKGDN